MNPTIIQPGEHKAQLLWTALILMFFCIQAVIWTVAISVTSSDLSHAVVAGYDEQALSWDEVKSAKQSSDNLDWQTTIIVDSDKDIRGNRNVTVEITDRSGNPVSDTNLQLRVFHRAAAGRPQQIQFTETKPGIYTSTLCVNRFGKWCFHGTATQRNKLLLIDQTVSIANYKG